MQNVNAGKIERSAIRALEALVDKYPRLSSQIQKNDKYPVWDGDILVYSANVHSVQFLKDRIPVQVKGRLVKTNSFSNGTLSYQLNVNHLKVYCNSGGIIFFVIEVDASEVSKIFYKSLLPIEIKHILKKSESRKTVTVKFNELTDTSYINLQLICDDFLIHRKKQYSLESPIQPAAFEMVKTVSLFAPTTDFAYLLHNETFFYMGPADFPPLMAEKGQVVSVASDYKCKVKISREYFSKIKIERSKNGYKIVFGSKLELDCREEEKDQQARKQFKVLLEGPLNEAKNTADFIADLVDKKNFKIDDKEFWIDNFGGKEETLISFAKELQTIMDLLTKLRLPLSIDMQKINTQKNLLLALADPIVNQKPSKERIFNRTDGVDCIAQSYCINVCGVLCYFLEMQTPQKGYMVYDFFAPYFTELHKFSIKWEDAVDGTVHNIESPFAAYYKFEYKDLQRIALESSNFNKGAVLKTIEQTHCSPEISGYLTRFLLDILKVYDEFTNEDFYVIADALSLKLVHEERSAINVINRMQVIRRKRRFNADEEKELAGLATTEQTPNMLCAVHILLENFFEAKKYLNEMDGKTKEDFVGFPIYNMMKMH